MKKIIERLKWHVNPCKVILSQNVRELCSLYFYIIVCVDVSDFIYSYLNDINYSCLIQMICAPLYGLKVFLSTYKNNGLLF